MLKQLKCDVILTYDPFSDEPDPSPLLIGKEVIILPQNKEVNPIHLAEKYTELFSKKQVCVLVPGTQFDESGTRHGRGGGWYDRFLSHTPREWTRVGVLKAKQLSKTPLVREVWDESMDYLALVSKENIKTIKTNLHK